MYKNLVVVSLSQQKLREQVEGLVARMNSRLVEPDPAFLKIAELSETRLGAGVTCCRACGSSAARAHPRPV